MSKTTKKQGMLSSEERKWNDPASILHRWRKDPNPVGRSKNKDEATDAIIEIKMITDVEYDIQQKFCGA